MTLQPGAMLGAYRIQKRIGMGGMATVYLAHDTSLDRYVALKVIHDHLTQDPEFAIRFIREARLVASLQHPHIIPVYTFETHPDLFMVSMYANAGSLADELATNPLLPLRKIATIISHVCEGLQYAHDRGMVHRDIKPDNILCNQQEANGLRETNYYIADFGIARLMNSFGNKLTSTGVSVGTPDYMPPEQTKGSLQLDGRADIYALGIMLFQLLSGALPYHGDDQLTIALAHLSEPLPDIRAINPTITPEMAEVVKRATMKDPNERYPNATEFAQSFSGSLQRSGNIPASAGGSTTGGFPRGRSLATLTGHAAQIYDTAWSPDSRKVSTASRDKTVRICEAQNGQMTITLSGHSDLVSSVSWSPDGAKIVTGSWDKLARVWDTRRGQSLLALSGHTDLVNSVAWSPDGSKIVTASWDKSARVWNASSGQALLILAGHTDAVWRAAWSPDGSKIVTAGADHLAGIWDAMTGQALLSLVGHNNEVLSVAWSPDGTKIATAGSDKIAVIWDARTGQALNALKNHDKEVSSVAWSPDGTKIVTGSWDKTAIIWDARTGQALLPLRSHDKEISSVAWSPDGAKIVTGSWDKTAIIWGI